MAAGSRATLLFALLALSGCNAILGIENATVKRTDDNQPSCAEDAAACSQSCAQGEACPEGQMCIEGTCTADADASVDGGVDGASFQDGAPDGELPDAQTDASDAGCVENELRCEGAALPTRLQCVAGAWKSGPACSDGQLCDSQSTPSGACKPVVDVCLGQKPGQGFCVGAERVLCGPDLVSATRKDCVESARCNLGTGGECAACNRNDAACEGDNLLLCKTDYSGFAFSETCKAGECRANLGRCSAMLCDPDAWSCAGKILEHCNATGSSYIEADRKDCGTGICDEFSGKCKVCEPNANLGCADATHQSLCDAEGSKIVTRACSELSSATPTCVGAGVCVQCAPGSKTCQDPRNAVACSGQGTATPSVCTGTTCVAGLGCSGECAPDTYKCSGSANPGRMKCGPEGLFNQSEMCEPGSLCDTATGQCKPVIEGCANQAVGAVVCVGSKRVTCGADLVNATSEQCASAELCGLGSGGKCATCTDSTWECRDAALWKCNATHDGMVLDKTCASAALCNANLKMCTDRKCEPNKNYCEGSTLKTCNATGSDVLSSVACPSGICDNTAGECDVCPANEYLRCSGNSRVKCNATGQGETTEPCVSPTPACTGKGQCVQCTPNTDTCSADLKVATHCDANGSRTTENCAANQTCFSGDCGGVCGPGQYQCGAAGTNARNACGPNGTFSVAANCASNEACEISSGQCKPVHEACTSATSANTWVCWDRTRVLCSADRLTVTLGNQCASSDLCKASSGNVCSVCLAGQRQCLQAKTQKCVSGQWQDDVICASAVWCSAGNCQTPSCTPNTTWRCANDKKNHELCNADGTGYNQVGTCGYCDDANPSICYQCQKDSYASDACWDGSNRKKCKSDGSGYAAESCNVAGSPGPFCTGTNRCVQCTTAICNGTTTLRKCVNGSYSDENCQTQSRTCFIDAVQGAICGGQCAVDQMRCNTGTKNPDKCVGNGVWQQVDTCAVPSKICFQASPTSASCVDNSPKPYGGYTTNASDAWQVWAVENGWAYFIPISAPFDLTLDAFHVRAAAAGGTCRMAIYANATGGGPGTLMAKGFSPITVTAAGVNSVQAEAAISLPKNQTYWVAARCNNAQLHYRNIASAVSYRFMTSSEFASNPAAEMRMGITYSFYVTAQQVP